MSSPSPHPTSPPPSAGAPASAAITRAWQHKGWLACSLLPVSWLYRGLVALRRSLYQRQLLRAYRAPVPVVVVGNVTAGGAGKTPVTIHLVQALRALGWQPGVVSRGYGRDTGLAPSPDAAVLVQPDSPPALVGDEPLLMARSAQVPVAVARRRADAVRALLAAHPNTNLIISDDGLQHLALARDVDIAVFNRFGVGNGWLLPAGPLREPWPRSLDIAVYADAPPPQLAATGASSWPMQRTLAPYAVAQDGRRVPLASLQGHPIDAVAAIAYPEEFFTMLRAQGLQLARCTALPDHAAYDDPSLFTASSAASPAPAEGTAERPTIAPAVLLCTEKDAHKLWPIAPHALAVPLHLVMDDGFAQAVNHLLQAQGHRPRPPLI